MNTTITNAQQLVCAMAQSHIEDIETGIEEGLYTAEENSDIDAKKKALEAFQASGNAGAHALYALHLIDSLCAPGETDPEQMAALLTRIAAIAKEVGSSVPAAPLENGPEPVKKVLIRRASNGTREYDAIRVVIADLHLNCDIASDRDIRLAKRLANASGLDLEVTPEVNWRVVAALAGLKD